MSLSLDPRRIYIVIEALAELLAVAVLVSIGFAGCWLVCEYQMYTVSGGTRVAAGNRPTLG